MAMERTQWLSECVSTEEVGGLFHKLQIQLSEGGWFFEAGLVLDQHCFLLRCEVVLDVIDEIVHQGEGVELHELFPVRNCRA